MAFQIPLAAKKKEQALTDLLHCAGLFLINLISSSGQLVQNLGSWVLAKYHLPTANKETEQSFGAAPSLVCLTIPYSSFKVLNIITSWAVVFFFQLPQDWISSSLICISKTSIHKCTIATLGIIVTHRSTSPISQQVHWGQGPGLTQPYVRASLSSQRLVYSMHSTIFFLEIL